jgi:hypothetical protein
MSQQMGDTVGDDAGFAAARSRQNEQRALDVLDRGALFGIELGEPELGSGLGAGGHTLF